MDSVEDVGSELEEAGVEGGSEMLYEIVTLLLLGLLEDMLLKYREETNVKGPASIATTQHCPTQRTNNQFCCGHYDILCSIRPLQPSSLCTS
jgi:hypothetical protein